MRVSAKAPKKSPPYQIYFSISEHAFQLLRSMQAQTRQRPGQIFEQLLYESKARQEGREEEKLRLLGQRTVVPS